ncbi:MAG: methyltransferase domain-containing protein [bacterium]|nr:methyltransferase domain-containing protein [bacterium]
MDGDSMNLTDANPDDLIARIQSGESIETIAAEYGADPVRLLDYCGNPFVYSSEWYDYGYHLLKCKTDTASFEEIRLQYEEKGYFKKLDFYFDQIQLPNRPVRWLEIGCHLGLSAYAAARRFPQIQIDMFDFSQKAVEWCQRTFPFPERARIWRCSCDHIHFGDDPLNDQYQVVTCLDVTEHLPKEVYINAVREICRVLSPYGILLLQQGNIPSPSHINVMNEKSLIEHFSSVNLKWLDTKPFVPKSVILHKFQKTPAGRPFEYKPTSLRKE